MSYIIQQVLPDPAAVKEDIPRTQDMELQVRKDRKELKDIISGKDSRKFLVIGPCSAWPSEDVILYARKIAKINTKISSKIKIVLRVYTAKPRTTIGWTGSINQPSPLQDPDINAGIYYSRKMMSEIIKLGLPIADEAVYTHNTSYLADLISWIAIGARSAEDPEHRHFASFMSFPVGLKNPTSGDIKTGVNSVLAAQNSHIFAAHKHQIKSEGNKYAHLILRGGGGGINLDKNSIDQAIALLQDQNIVHPAIMADVSHDNSIDPITGKKDYSRQSDSIFDVLRLCQKNKTINKFIKGFMIESFLVAGNQNINKVGTSDFIPGQSITDACIGFDMTEETLMKMFEYL